jgi:hypothetical protein
MSGGSCTPVTLTEPAVYRSGQPMTFWTASAGRFSPLGPRRMAKKQKNKSEKAMKPAPRKTRSEKLTSGKEAILDRYGGFQFGESLAKPSLRMKEIDTLEAAF